MNSYICFAEDTLLAAISNDLDDAIRKLNTSL